MVVPGGARRRADRARRTGHRGRGGRSRGRLPPAHVHADLDDSFYLLDGRMVIHCGDEVWEAGPGSWVQFPAGVPHTFRVLGGPARALWSTPTTASWPRCADRPPGHRNRHRGSHAGPHHRGTRPGVRRPRHHQCRPADGTGRGRAPARPTGRSGYPQLAVTHPRSQPPARHRRAALTMAASSRKAPTQPPAQSQSRTSNDSVARPGGRPGQAPGATRTA